MYTVDLTGLWKMRILGENIYGISPDYIEAKVPGSIYGTLLEKGLMPDPYYRDNEQDALKLMENDFEYITKFSVSEEMRKDSSGKEYDAILLQFCGIDTLADIYLNGVCIGHAYNMHRTWEFDVWNEIKTGINVLSIVLHSPTKYCREENAKVFTGGSSDSVQGFPHLRKAHCMLGWDWGPRLPDAGIFRGVNLLMVNNSRIDSVYITQIHEENKVTLDFDVTVELFGDTDDTYVEVSALDPDGKIYEIQKGNEKEPVEGEYKIAIDSPKLWWPHGYGAQPLYRVKAVLRKKSGEILDSFERHIGLRTMSVNTKEDEWGNNFAHEVNGVQIFAMGADYIPEDNILGRITPERTRKLLKECVEANYNTIRVWGGGYYPDDYFYDICDELGLVIWQDFMFACASYELDDDFEANISAEIAENVRRLRHHACIGIWCGNNELEAQVMEKEWSPSIKQTYDYIKIFEYIFPKIVKEEDPQGFYWPSSPSSGGNFDNPTDENRGDAHYWQVWHGNKPFTAYRDYYFRYLSEFGFQSFPCLKTVEAFTEEKDRNVFSRVMEMHQRNRAANGKIMNYLSATYLFPKDFEQLLYASQLLQADAIRYGVEHFRRYRGRCMGTVVWQLNDIWPVASWSSIDYFGRWKALHYAEKRMFAPVMISCEEKGEISERPFCILEPAPIEKSAKLHVANETMQEVTGEVKWKLCNPDSSIIKEGKERVTIPALSGIWLNKLDFSEYDELSMNMSYSFEIDGKTVSSNACLFTAPKHYRFLDPHLSWKLEGRIITIRAEAFAQKIEIEGVDGDIKLSDNFFDMQAGEYRVEILEGSASQIKIKSVYDIANI